MGKLKALASLRPSSTSHSHRSQNASDVTPLSWRMIYLAWRNVCKKTVRFDVPRRVVEGMMLMKDP
jgi:hypothetical protein